MADHGKWGTESFECVDPAWGNQLWRYDEPDLEAAIRSGLDDHLFICDACQLVQASQEALVDSIRTGAVRTTRPVPMVARVVRIPSLRWGSAVALAASLVLMLVVPPNGRQAGGLRRGDESVPRFQRPVEGEILRSEAPELKWSPIPGATSYEVQVSEVGGDYLWSGETDVPSIRIPAERPLPDDGIFRGLVRPVPADLVDVTGVSVAFSRSGWREFLVYRANAAPLWLRFLAALGVLGWVVGSILPRRKLNPA